MFICALVNPSDTSIIKMTSQNNTKTEYFASTMDTIAFDNEQIDITNQTPNPECTLTRSTCDGCIFVDGEFIQQNVSIEQSSPNDSLELCLQNAYCVSPALRIHHPIPTFVPLFGIVPEYFAAIMDATVCDNEQIDITNQTPNPECTLTRSTCDGCIFVDGEFIQQNVSIGTIPERGCNEVITK
jgi:hypothetical protein